MDRGPLLTSAIIFYLAIGAAIFEVLEEPHWKEAKKKYYTEKLHLLTKFPCLGQEGLDEILQVRRRFAPYERTPDAGSSSSSEAGTRPARLWVILGPRGLSWGDRRGVSSWIWLPGSFVHPWTRESPWNPVCPERI